MKITSKHLAQLKRFVGPKKFLPILQKIAYDGRTWIASNLDQTLLIEAGGPETGVYSIDQIKAHIAGENVAPSDPIEDFPSYDSPQTRPFSGDWAGVVNLLRVCSKDESRCMLCGIRFAENSIEATDGKICVALDSGEENKTPFTCPRQTIEAMKGLVPDSYGFAGGKIAFSGDGWKVISKEIEGRFPDTKQVFPKANPSDNVIDIRELPTFKAVDRRNPRAPLEFLDFDSGTQTLEKRENKNVPGIVCTKPTSYAGIKCRLGLDLLQTASLFTDALQVKQEEKLELGYYYGGGVALVMMPMRRDD